MEERRIAVRSSLSDQAADLIKERIFNQEFAPGERLVVEKLADEIQVSRTPIREGLRVLVQEGLVNYDGKSYTIFNPTMEDVKEIFAIRQALESLAARCAATNMPPEEIEHLREIIREYESGNSKHSLVEIDIKFHDALIHGAANSRLERIVANMREQLKLIRNWVAEGIEEGTQESETIQEHQQVLDGISRRDGLTASEAMMRHLDNGQRRTIKNLKNRHLLIG
jgi:DNA-binding GntR family transcriptional regulator